VLLTCAANRPAQTISSRDRRNIVGLALHATFDTHPNLTYTGGNQACTAFGFPNQGAQVFSLQLRAADKALIKAIPFVG